MSLVSSDDLELSVFHSTQVHALRLLDLRVSCMAAVSFDSLCMHLKPHSFSP